MTTRGEISVDGMLAGGLDELQQIAGVIRLAREMRPAATLAKQAEIDEIIASLQAEFDRLAAARASLLELFAVVDWHR